MNQKSCQQGVSTVDILLGVGFALCCLFLLSSQLPARVDDVKEVAAIAESSTQAKLEFAASLQKTPNPNRSELRAMRSRVNEILVTETARAVTGNDALNTPSQIDAARKKEEAASAIALGSKGWSDMNIGERVQYLYNQTPTIVGGLVGVLLIVGLLLALATRINRDY